MNDNLSRLSERQNATCEAVTERFLEVAFLCTGSDCTTRHMGRCIDVPELTQLHRIDDLLFAWLVASDGAQLVTGAASGIDEDGYATYLHVRELARSRRYEEEIPRTKWCMAQPWQACQVHGPATTPLPRIEVEQILSADKTDRKRSLSQVQNRQHSS